MDHKPGSTLAESARSYLSERRAPFVLILLTAVLLACAGLLAPGFAAPSNLIMVVSLASFVGIAVLGQAAVMITGGIDLSIPWMVTFGAVLFGMLSNGQDAGLPLAIAGTLAAAVAVGIVHAGLIESLRVSPIVVTLATAGILQGITLVITNGTPSAAPPPFIGDLAHNDVAGIPLRLLVWALMAVACAIIFKLTSIGRHLFAFGENRLAAGIAGVAGFRTLAAAYGLSAFCAALAGILFSGFSGMSYLGMGDEFLMPSIAACVIGGVSIYGGFGRVSGVVAGALFVFVLGTVLTVANLTAGFKLVATGLVILAAIVLVSNTRGDSRT